jgi:hypothetical protein
MSKKTMIFLKIFVILTIAFVLCEANPEGEKKKVKVDPIKEDESDKDYVADEEPEVPAKEHVFLKNPVTLQPISTLAPKVKVTDKPTTVKIIQSAKVTPSKIVDDDYEYKEDDAEEIQDSEDEKAKDKKYMEIHIFEDSVGHSPIFHSSGLAAVFAATILILSMVVYGGLIMWRRRLDRRYGMRERLVTNDEDEVYRRTEIRYLRV